MLAARGLLLVAAVLLVGAEASFVLPKITEQKLFDGSVLPEGRPPLPPSYRSLSTLLEPYSCEPKGNGFVLTLKHGRFDNINSAMVQWLFANMATAQVDISGTSYPLFLALHPSDHALVKLEGGGSVVKSGSQLTFFEFPLTKCDGSDDGLIWTCPQPPTGNPGWLRPPASSLSEWQWLDSTNVTSTVLSFKKNKIRFGNKGCKPAGSPCAYAVKTTHSWKDDKDSATPGLYLTSQVRVGIGMKNNDITIAKKWANGIVTNNTDGSPNYSLKCARVAAHMTQEWGTIQGWLADAYNKAPK